MSEVIFLPHEKWDDIVLPNNEGVTRKYAVSNFGRVVSYTTNINSGSLLAQNPKPKGSLEITIKIAGKKVRLKIHKLVAQYFLPKPPEHFNYVIHKNRNTADNNVNNLMFVNYSMYLQYMGGKNVAALQPLKLFVGETYKIIDEPFVQKKYAITNLGRLISFDNVIEDGAIIDGAMHEEGYKIWRYKVGKQYKHKLIHRLVAEYFLDKPSNEHKFVIHLDYNKLNNVTNNLQWATQSQVTAHNALSKAAMEKSSNNTKYYLQKGMGKKLTLGKVVLLKKILKETNNPTRKRIIAKQFGISPMQLLRIQKGENWGWLNENTLYNHLSINEN